MPNPKRVRRAKRSDSEAKRPSAPYSIPIIVFSVISLIVLVSFIIVAIQTSGNTAHVLAGVGVLFMLTGIVISLIGIRRGRNPAYSFVSRLLTIILPLLSSCGWLYLYFAGAFLG